MHRLTIDMISEKIVVAAVLRSVRCQVTMARYSLVHFE